MISTSHPSQSNSLSYLSFIKRQTKKKEKKLTMQFLNFKKLKLRFSVRFCPKTASNRSMLTPTIKSLKFIAFIEYLG